jgi:N-terminal domain of argonaute
LFAEDKYADKKKVAEVEQPVQQEVQLTVQPAAAVSPTFCFGTKGIPVQIEVNYFPMKVDKLINEAFHYHARFVPPGPKKMTRLALAQIKQKHFNKVAYGFDGAYTMFTNMKLDKDLVEEEIEVNPDESRAVKFKVSLKLVGTVDLQVMKE